MQNNDDEFILVDMNCTKCYSDRNTLTEKMVNLHFLPKLFQKGEHGMGLLKNIFGKKEDGIQIYAPAGGKLVPLSEVSDPTFAEGILGQGAALVPSGNQFFSPVDGTAATVFPTGHAVALTSEDGVEVLLHIGLDTVKLNGKYFTIHVEEGQQVKKGDLLLEADLEKIRAEGFDTVTPIVICNTDEFAEVVMAEEGEVETGDIVLHLKK